MTDIAADIREVADAQPRERAHRKAAPIVPPQSLSGTALIIVIAIMTFLSSLTLGAVSLVRDAAGNWESEIAREATIQIKPADRLDMEAALLAARAEAEATPGVHGAKIVDRAATARLLEPWLGSGLNIDELPVPRLIVITIDPFNPPDFAALRAGLTRQTPSASLDDHRTWVDRLVAMARTTVAIGMAVLVLILAATTLCVIFATRGAMAGNGQIIEVLHFVGAEGRFIALQFRKHFLTIGIKGAAAGGVAAILVFIAFSLWSARNLATPEADQATALFGNFAIGLSGYMGVALIVLLIALLTAATTQATVVAYLKDIDTKQPEL